MVGPIPVLILLVVGALSLAMGPGIIAPQESGIVGLYRNATEGFSVLLPEGWVGEEGDGTTPLLSISGTTGDARVFSEVWIFRRPDGLSADDWMTSQMAQYSPNSTISRGPHSFPGADSADQTLITTLLNNGNVIYELWTAVARGSQMFLLRVQALEQSWPMVEPVANAFTDSFTLESQMSFGASRDDSLFQSWGEIVSIDPAYSRGGPSGIVGAIFSGLVKLDTKLQVTPDIAEAWEVSPDGAVFTFTLRDNARFHDGRPVTAADFKYSWERALRPETESPTAATYLGDIVGADAMLDGQAPDLAGVQALDARTLRVAIDAPRPYFLFKLAFPTGYVVDAANVESGEDWTDAPNGAGAFKLKRWEKEELLVLERNEDWYGGLPALAHAVYRIYAGNPMQLYENGDIDMVRLGVYNVDRAQDPANALHDQLRTGTSFCTTYLGFNVTQPPFDDPRVRQALALAMEVDKEIAVSLRGLVRRATGFVPPGMPAHNENLAPFDFDLETAMSLLGESRYGGTQGLPPIRSFVSDGAIHWAWREHLGLEIEAVSVFDFADWLERMDNMEFGVFRSGWCADYPDPQNFLEILFHSDSAENSFGYSNDAVDALLDEAGVEPDAARRAQLYQQAEGLVLDDWVAVPLWHSQSFMLVQTYVKGFEVTPIGVPQLQNISIERQP